eukprot:3897032-Rhodomonas_salina.1
MVLAFGAARPGPGVQCQCPGPPCRPVSDRSAAAVDAAPALAAAPRPGSGLRLALKSNGSQGDVIMITDE